MPSGSRIAEYPEISDFMARCKIEADKGKLDEFIPPIELVKIPGEILDMSLDWVRSQPEYPTWHKQPWKYKEETMRRLICGWYWDLIEFDFVNDVYLKSNLET